MKRRSLAMIAAAALGCGSEREAGTASDLDAPPTSAPAGLQGAPGLEVNLMIMKTDFESPAAAVESLEATVTSLTEGITVEVAGQTRTHRVDFEPFMEGLGDQAVWAPKLREPSVAHDGTRFAVTARTAGDAAENKALAIALARLAMGVL